MNKSFKKKFLRKDNFLTNKLPILIFKKFYDMVYRDVFKSLMLSQSKTQNLIN